MTLALDDLLAARDTTTGTLIQAGVLDRRTLHRLRRGFAVRPSSLRRLADALGVPVELVADAVLLGEAERELAPGHAGEA
jgi:DNA-binding Xre family transcriptional regulator